MNEVSKGFSLLRLRVVEPLMNWDDIKEGEWYHMPPLIFNKRFDFLVVEKSKNTIRIMKRGDDYPQTMFRTDVTSRFIVKKWELHGTT